MSASDPYYVYFLTTRLNTVLYTGITEGLKERTRQHKEGVVQGFTKRYKVHKLVYYEMVEDRESAQFRERQIKNYARNKKMSMITDFNPHWVDLYDSIEESY
jgi:putative endonuclease